MSDEKFSGVTHFTQVDVQPGGINIQHVEHLHQSDILNALGIELEMKPKGKPALADAEEMPADKSQERNKERFRFVHPEIGDDEAWRIHDVVKRLVAHQRVPEICAYLRELKQKGKVMLPSNSGIMYNELVRLGMPTGEGYSEKHFSNSYTK